MTLSLGIGPRPVRQGWARLRAPVIAVAAVVLVSAAGVGVDFLTSHNEPAPGGTVVEGLVVDGPLVLLPPLAPNQNSRDVSSLLDRGLTRVGPDGRPAAELASSWEVDDSSKTFTFHLRPGLQWSDGVPVTSADALYTLSVLQDVSQSQTIAGQAWSGISAAAPDASTVVYTLPSPSAAFVSLTAMGLIPEHYLKPRPVAALPMVLDAPTTGPFRYDKSDRNTVSLKRNPRSIEPARLDGILLRRYDSAIPAMEALLSGDVDILGQLEPAQADRVGSTPNRHLARTASFAYTQLLFNQGTPALGDVGVRQGLLRAIDRLALIRNGIKGYAWLAGSPIPPGITWVGSGPDVPGLDRGAAEDMLDKAGWLRPGGGTRTKDGHDLVLRLLSVDVDPYPTLAAAIKSDLGKVGVRVDLVQQPEGRVVESLSKGDFDMALMAIDNGPDPDVYALWHSSQENSGGANYSRMPKDAFLDKALEDGRAKSDIDARKAAYADVRKSLIDGAAAVFLYSPDQLIGLTNRLQGVRLNPAMESGGRYDYAQEWYVNTRRVR